MRKKYYGLKAEKIDFGRYDEVATSSTTSCLQVTANVKHPETQLCTNPSDTSQNMWILDNPYGD